MTKLWPWILANYPAILTGIGIVLPSLITACTPYPTADGWLKRVQQLLQLLSVVGHQNSAVHLKLPLTLASAPKAAPVAVATGGAIKALLPLLLLAAFSQVACAGVSFGSPVFYAGPAVAPIEEVSSKHPSPAAAAGYQATIGLGQFDWASHEWDALDLSALALGGVVLPGTGPVGALQLGGEIGTLNGIIGLGILSTPYMANGGGWTQGGAPGTTFAGMLNIQALVTYFAPSSGKDSVRARLPRGGL